MVEYNLVICIEVFDVEFVEDKMIFKENTIIWTETGSVVSLLLMNYTWEVKTISIGCTQ
jgi:hypothetical protein